MQSASDKRLSSGWLQPLAGLVIGGVLIALAVQAVEWVHVEQALAQADIGWVLIAVLISAGSHWLRGLRWQMLLAANGYAVSQTNTFAATMVGYLTNLAIPRLGEVTRCTMLWRSDGIPIETNIGVVVLERVVDVLTLCVLLTICFVVESEKLLQLVPFGNLTIKVLILAVVGIVGLGFAFLLYRTRETWTQAGIGQKIYALAEKLIKSLLSIRSLPNPPGFILLSIAIWGCYIAITYCAFLALPQTAHLSLYFSLLITTLGAVGMTLPSPGGFGTFHQAFILGFQAFNLSKDDGLAVALVIHEPGVVMTLLLGALSFGWLWFRKKE